MGVSDPRTEVRRAVRAALHALPPPYRGVPPLVACSGGADSLALALAARDVDAGLHAAVVDHGLQPDSARVAAETVVVLAGIGVPATVHRVEVDGPGGVEAAARRVRYAALRHARPHPDSPVLLGHTRDDQAETVLLGLGRGSGPRSIAGMRVWDAPWARPLLAVDRAVTRAACAAQGLPVWDDPHNSDARFTRVRLRHEVLPLLEDVLHGGVAAALARTAAQLREDSDALDALAQGLLTTARDPDDLRGTDDLLLEPLVGCPAALRRRVLRAWLMERAVTGLTDVHLRAVDVLAAQGHDRGSVALPGGLELVRGHGRLGLRPVGWPATHAQEDIPRVRR